MSIFQNQWVESRVMYDEDDGGEPAGGAGGAQDNQDGDAGAGDQGDAGNPGDSGDGNPGDGDVGDGSGDQGDAGDAGQGTPSWLESTPEDWRQQIAGDDEKKLKRLERFTDFNHYMSNTFDEHDKLRQGELKGARPDGSDETALNEWREANGIPIDGKYTIELPEGVDMMDEDQRIIDAVMPIAQAADVSEATLNALTETMLKARAVEVDNLLKQDALEAQQREQMLRDTWKGDYDVNMQAIENFISREIPEELHDVFRKARGADGKGLFNNPAMMAMLAKVERTLNPMSTIPGAGNNDVQSARNIVDEAKRLFKEDRKAYQDPAFQKKYDAAIEYLQSQGEKI